MRRNVTFEKIQQGTGFIRLFRNISLIIVVFSISIAFGAEESSVMTLYRQGKFKEVVGSIEVIKKEGRKLSYKEHVLLVTAYKKLGDLDGKIAALKVATEQYPSKDAFKRELARSLEVKSNSYTKSKTYDLIRKKLKNESIEILSELYKESPTKENFTALIEYYNREEDYAEAVGLLEFYGRRNPKGKIYYTHLCKAQYNSKLYSTAAETCKKLSEAFPKSSDGHWYYGKALEKAGESQAAQETFLKISGRFPASGAIQYEAGKALIEQGETTKGLAHLEKHLKLEASDEALVLKAETLFGLKKYDEALETFIEACKQHQEPRKPLINKMKAAAKSFGSASEYRNKYNRETSRCKYVYRPNRKAPKGLLGGGYGTE